MIGLPYGEKNYDDMLSRFHTIPACHGQTDDRRTELLYQYRASVCWRVIKTTNKNCNNNVKVKIKYMMILMSKRSEWLCVVYKYVMQTAVNARERNLLQWYFQWGFQCLYPEQSMIRSDIQWRQRAVHDSTWPMTSNIISSPALSCKMLADLVTCKVSERPKNVQNVLC